jgi:hypothetical protein
MFNILGDFSSSFNTESLSKARLGSAPDFSLDWTGLIFYGLFYEVVSN